MGEFSKAELKKIFWHWHEEASDCRNTSGSEWEGKLTFGSKPRNRERERTDL